MLNKRTQYSRYMPLIAVVALVAMIGLMVSFTTGKAVAAPPTEKDFFGIVLSVNGNVLQVSSDEGIVDVTTSDITAIVRPLNPRASLDDLLEGDNVAISLNDNFVATAVFVIPGKTQFRHVPGEVTQTDGDTITLQPLTEGSDPVTFNITPETQIKLGTGATELVEGVFAVVLAKRDGLTGKLSSDAIEVHVTAGKPQKADPTPSTPVGGDAESRNRATVEGIFEGLDAFNNWIVGGTTIVVDANAQIVSGIVIGQLIKVDATLDQDGIIYAREIEAEQEDNQRPNRVRLEGYFERVDNDGSWIVSSKVVIIGDDTDTDGIPFVGQRVRIEGVVLENGSIAARETENRVGKDDEQDDEAEIRLEGILERVDDEGKWVVNGIKISISEITLLKGSPAVGSPVSIRAIVRGDRILALKIEAEEPGDESNPGARGTTEFRGIVEEVQDDGSFFISGRHIILQDTSEVEGDIATGVSVKVVALLLDDGTIVARSVEVEDEDEDYEIDEQRRIRIEGKIESVLNRTTIVVNGLTIVLSPEIQIVDLATALGKPVNLVGILQDNGTVLALRLRAITQEDNSGHNEDAQEQDTETVKLEGFVARFGGGILELGDGTLVTIASNTRLEGNPYRGAELEVEATRTVDGLVALRIKVERPEREDFEGTVKGFSNRRLELQDGTVFRVNAETRLDGNPTVGKAVEVRAFVFPQDSPIALEIKVKDSDSSSDSARIQSEQAPSPDTTQATDSGSSSDSGKTQPDQGLSSDTTKVNGEKREYESVVVGREFNKVELRDGTVLIITDYTKIRGRVSVGAVVEVKAQVRADGTVEALEIRSEEEDSSSGSGRGSN